MKQRNCGVLDLAVAGAAGHLQMGFDQMRHRTADAAMAVAQEPAMGVERHLAISAEIAGFDPTSGVVAMAVRELGPERVVYGSDVGGRSFASQLAKVMGADVPDSAKELVLGGNLRRLFAPILRAKGYQA